MELKAGDKVEVVDAGMTGRNLKVGHIYTIDRVTSDDGVVLVGLPPGNWFYPSRFRLVETSTPEIGDTVEVTTKRGTVIRGEVTAVGGSGGLNFDGGTVYVSEGDTKSVTIIEKAVKPKVWAVGDVVSADDYASDTIKDGTLVGTTGDSIVKSEYGWIDCRTGENYQHSNLHAARTIVYIP